MPSIDVVVETKVSRTARARQLEAMFDVPASERAKLTWKGELPIEQRDWNVGLIVGPSGCGKSTILRDVFGEPAALKWGAASVIDDFAPSLAMQDIATACQSVGFNTIPAWLRPFSVLSNGEQFRATLARLLLETEGTAVVDEFTSVVDRAVAKIGAHAVQKVIRKRGGKFVAASCHYDIIDWLQPDWMLEPATMAFRWRSLQRRPSIEVELRRVSHSAWELFAPFHYLTADLHKAAACWCLFVAGVPTAFAGVLHRPHPTRKNIKGVSRLVTLPDWQGLGLALALVDELGSIYSAAGYELRTYPAHPALIRSFDRSPVWKMEKRPGHFSPRTGQSGLVSTSGKMSSEFGGRPCAVFSYRGKTLEDKAEAKRLLAA